ncbi:MFS transporter [Shinella sedimenti]|uniref:MFS transporter n=1 Tax=Shinella sedimenti TaxID=2919913 RepID=A0ABT0CR59_9HYPH|nr:MFS transporter [Shinella sedimenti]MCJ8151103.1 MFS transporter [Shinella sedimenti]
MKQDSAPVSGRLLLLAAIVLVGLNLRPFITGVGPLAAGISLQTGLDLQGLSLLTLVPMFLMGAVAFAGTALQARVGARHSILVALAVLAAASLLRLFVWTGWQMVATAALLGLGAAAVQAMFPGIMKRHFPDHVGVVMGLYATMLMGGGAVGAQLAPLIAAAAGDWHAGLAWIALPALLALWLCARSLSPDAQSVGGISKTGAPLRRPRTWLLMACFGLVNGGYSTAVAWLSPFYRDLGWSASASGSLLVVSMDRLGMPDVPGQGYCFLKSQKAPGLACSTSLLLSPMSSSCSSVSSRRSRICLYFSNRRSTATTIRRTSLTKEPQRSGVGVISEAASILRADFGGACLPGGAAGSAGPESLTMSVVLIVNNPEEVMIA